MQWRKKSIPIAIWLVKEGETVQAKEISWVAVAGIAAGAIISAVVLYVGLDLHLRLPVFSQASNASTLFLQVVKLIAAALAGLAITVVYRRRRGDKPASPALDQTQILLCVVGALMTIVIGDSLPRALGFLGGASVIRFRTPVKDPQNATILFALLALGVACGLGAFAVAGMGTVFFCLLLTMLDSTGESKQRTMQVELVSEAPEFPLTHVQNVFAQYGLAFETREFPQASEAVMTYNISLDPRTSLKDVTAHLLNGKAGIKSVAWQAPKKDGGGRGL